MATKVDRIHSHSEEEEVSEPLPNKLLLPDDVIVEILCRISVKSLLKFRCVCKSWLHLISDPQFIKSHLNISSQNQIDDRIRVVTSYIRTHLHYKYLNTFSLHSALYEQSFNAFVVPDYPLKYSKHGGMIVGSSNGLVCLATESRGCIDMFIWNPATRKSMKLPSLKSNFDITYGFGYDEFTNDYVAIVLCFRGAGEVNVYTLRTDSWRRIMNFTDHCPSDSTLKFANGAFHWISREIIDSKCTWHIVSLDLRTEVFGKVTQPNYGNGKFDLTLGVLGGCLCVICYKREIGVDIWIMNEYGVVESWCKLVSIPHWEDILFSYVRPLYILKNGEFLLYSDERGLVIYNSKDGTFKDSSFPKFVYCFEGNTYIESLVSPSIH